MGIKFRAWKIAALILITTTPALGQYTYRAVIKDMDTGEPLPGADAVIRGTTIGTSADKNGNIYLKNIPGGRQTLVFSFIGYRPEQRTLLFPAEQVQPDTVLLKSGESIEPVVVHSFRTNNRIENIPTRVEVLGLEEVKEETNINPGNISKLLGETSGIRVQQTSAVSGNVSFRIQGLPGKYTQMLQDGFPLYSGFSSGLSLLQIPPLNLQQVEVVRGSASTLYGGSAIAGIVNLITKQPVARPEFDVLLNQTHKGGNDIGVWYAEKKGKLGITLLASRNTQKPVDISKNGFTDIPEYNRAVLEPRLFYDLNENNHLMTGLSSVCEDRTGGDIFAVRNQADSSHAFYEENKTRRTNGILKFESTLQNGNVITIKGNISSYKRGLFTNTNNFRGRQVTAYTEGTYLINSKQHKWVTGFNLLLDRFVQNKYTGLPILDYYHLTTGFFSQDDWKISEKLSFEPGIRLDVNNRYGVFFLPRLALLYKPSNNLLTRFSGGMGYEIPTPFSEHADRTRFQNVLPPTDLKAERSSGLNMDIHFNKRLGEDLNLSVNQGLFVTRINTPVIADQDSLMNQTVFYENAAGSILSKGLNTNIRLSYEEAVLYIDYTFLDARKKYDLNLPLELSPKHRLTTTLAWEDEETGLRMGLEAFYFGPQYLENGDKTADYWLLGAMIQKTFGHFTVAANVENILDVRQTRYENIVVPPLENPSFNELYAPLDGIVGNIVLMFKLY